MKKSEFVEARTEIWTHRTSAQEAIRQKVQEDVFAAEAAGKVWDPEETPPPERLTYAAGSAHTLLTPMLFPEGSATWRTRDEQLQGYAEAVRRYNLFPRIAAALRSPNKFTHELVAEALQIMGEEEG